MRTIDKSQEGYHHLDKPRANPPANAAQAETRWRAFGHKRELSGLLKDEQFGLCAYTELRPDMARLGTHIEHIKPKSIYHDLTFDYQNLVLSALSDADLQTLARENVFGGHAKTGQFDEARFISPLNPRSAEYFTYVSDGRVVPNNKLPDIEQANAQYTIDVLNLNADYLVTERAKWIDEIDEWIDEHIQKDMSLPHLAAVYLLPRDGRFDPFYSAARQRFGPLAEQLLNDAD